MALLPSRELSLFPMFNPLASPAAAARAIPPAVPTPALSAKMQTPWFALSMVDANAATAWGGGGAGVAAHPDNNGGGGGFPPIPVLLIWLLTLGVAIWIVTKNNN